MMRALALILLFGLGACSAPPQLPPLQDPGTSPGLAPLNRVLSASEQQARLSNPQSSVLGRLGSLQSRAAALRGPVLSTTERRKLSNGPARPAALQ